MNRNHMTLLREWTFVTESFSVVCNDVIYHHLIFFSEACFHLHKKVNSQYSR
jgi:hypothetical protein